MNFRFAKRAVEKHFFKSYMWDPLPTSVEIGLVLSTASLLDSTSAIFPVSHFFKRTTHNEEPLNGVASCLTSRHLKFAVSSRRREPQHLPQPQLRAPKLHLQSSAPASKQQLDQDQRVHTGQFSCGVLFSCFSCSSETLYRWLHFALLRSHAFLAQTAILSVPTLACVIYGTVILSGLHSLLTKSTTGHEVVRGFQPHSSATMWNDCVVLVFWDWEHSLLRLDEQKCCNTCAFKPWFTLHTRIQTLIHTHRSTTWPLYFWNLCSNSEFLRWYKSISVAKWTVLLSFCAFSMTSLLIVAFVDLFPLSVDCGLRIRNFHGRGRGCHNVLQVVVHQRLENSFSATKSSWSLPLTLSWRFRVDSWASTRHARILIFDCRIFSAAVFPVPRVLNLTTHGGFRWHVLLFSRVFEGIPKLHIVRIEKTSNIVELWFRNRPTLPRFLLSCFKHTWQLQPTRNLVQMLLGFFVSRLPDHVYPSGVFSFITVSRMQPGHGPDTSWPPSSFHWWSVRLFRHTSNVAFVRLTTPIDLIGIGNSSSFGTHVKMESRSGLMVRCVSVFAALNLEPTRRCHECNSASLTSLRTVNTLWFSSDTLTTQSLTLRSTWWRYTQFREILQKKISGFNVIRLLVLWLRPARLSLKKLVVPLFSCREIMNRVGFWEYLIKTRHLRCSIKDSEFEVSHVFGITTSFALSLRAWILWRVWIFRLCHLDFPDASRLQRTSNEEAQ